MNWRVSTAIIRFSLLLVCVRCKHQVPLREPLESSSQLWWYGRGSRAPRFKDTPTNASAHVGESAFLPCSVLYLGDKSVTWMRQRDLHILTAGMFTYSADERFRVLHPEHTNDWTLQIRFVTSRDSGVYECQVNSDPKISRAVALSVADNNQLDDPGSFVEGGEPTVLAIEGPSQRYIQEGSVLELTCAARHEAKRGPRDLFWFHDDELHSYDSKRGGVSTHTEKTARRTVSRLIVSAVRPADSGSYRCTDGKMEPVAITVHVQKGQFLAAVQQKEANAAAAASAGKCLLASLLASQPLWMRGIRL